MCRRPWCTSTTFCHRKEHGSWTLWLTRSAYPGLSGSLPMSCSGRSLDLNPEAKTTLSRKFGSPSTSEGEPIRGSYPLAPSASATLGSDLQGLTRRDCTFWKRITTARMVSGLGRPLRRAVGKTSKPGFKSRHEVCILFRRFHFRDRVCSRLRRAGAAFLSTTPGLVLSTRRGIVPKAIKLLLNTSIGCQGSTAFLIALTCTDNSSSSRGQTHYFQHIPGSGKVRAIKAAAIRPVFSHLYFDEKGTDVWMTFEDRTIWSSVPGKKDLRLWPLQTL